MKICAVVFEFIVSRQTDRQTDRQTHRQTDGQMRQRTLFYNMYRLWCIKHFKYYLQSFQRLLAVRAMMIEYDYTYNGNKGATLIFQQKNFNQKQESNPGTLGFDFFS